MKDNKTERATVFKRFLITAFGITVNDITDIKNIKKRLQAQDNSQILKEMVLSQAHHKNMNDAAKELLISGYGFDIFNGGAFGFYGGAMPESANDALTDQVLIAWFDNINNTSTDKKFFESGPRNAIMMPWLKNAKLETKITAKFFRYEADFEGAKLIFQGGPLQGYLEAAPGKTTDGKVSYEWKQLLMRQEEYRTACLKHSPA